MVALLHKIKGEFGRSEDAVDAKQDQDEAPNQHRNEHEHEHAHVNHEHESPEVEEGRSQERTPRGEDLADNTSTSLTAEAGAVAPIELTEEQKQMQALLEEFNSKGVPQVCARDARVPGAVEESKCALKCETMTHQLRRNSRTSFGLTSKPRANASWSTLMIWSALLGESCRSFWKSLTSSLLSARR